LVQSKEEINGKITPYSDEKCNEEIELPRGETNEITLELGEPRWNLQCVKNDVIKAGFIDMEFTNGECFNQEKILKLLEQLKAKFPEISYNPFQTNANAQGGSFKISWTGACTGGISTGAIVGIVIGCLVVLILIGVAAYFCCIKKEEKVIVYQY
jgi:hypothetical protein